MGDTRIGRVKQDGEWKIGQSRGYGEVIGVTNDFLLGLRPAPQDRTPDYWEQSL